ncbi:MAG: nuclear transport factor 2 family protein [Acidobacteriota bacterium]
MRTRLFGWVVVGVVALGCMGAEAQSCTTQPEDKDAVVATVRSMFAAATADDITKLRSVFAPGAYLFDNGKRFDSVDDLIALIDASRAKGMKYMWTVTDPDVHVHCDHAWLAYVNVGSVWMPGANAATPMKWLESGELEKQGGVWKVVFFHSTRVPADH